MVTGKSYNLPKFATHFWSMLHFYTPWKHQEIRCLFSEGRDVEHWPEKEKVSCWDWTLTMQERSQLEFTCSKLTIETLKQGVNYVQS